MNNPKKFKSRKKKSPKGSPEKMPWITVGFLVILCTVSLVTGIYYWYTAYFRPAEYVRPAHLEGLENEPPGEEAPYPTSENPEDTGDMRYETPPLKNEAPPPLPRPQIDPLPEFAALREEHGNDDIVGILTLAGAEALVVQGENTPEGWLILNPEADLLMGIDHNMIITVPGECEIFHVLRSYMEYDFFLMYPTISFSTIYGPFDWEIFSFYVAPDIFPFAVANHPNDDIWGDLLEQFTMLSFYNTMLDVTMYDQVLTLTAPTEAGADLFYVLQARMLRQITS